MAQEVLVAHDKVYTKEFPADLAGERVGWVSVDDIPNHPDLVGVNVVVATIDDGGARYTNIMHTFDDGEILFSPKADEGILAVAGLYATISRQEGIAAQSHFSSANRVASNGNILQAGGSGYLDYVPEEEDKTWADNSGELLDMLKSGLKQKNVFEHYPAVYYLLNGKLARETNSWHSLLHNYSPLDLFIPDPYMAVATTQQITLVESIRNALEAAKVEDEQMRRRLTVFSDLPADKITATFAESRRSVALYEKTVLAALPGLYAPQTMYLPIGFNGGGRVWPYMDPLANDEDLAFGVELSALEAKDISRANQELTDELNELKDRLTYTRFGEELLWLLLRAEQQAA